MLKIQPAGLPPAIARAPRVPAPARAAAPAVASGSARPQDIKVITFNTAVGNSAIKTKQADFVKLPFYQQVLNGAADAPILCLQEVGNAQHKAVAALAQSGQFTPVYTRVGLWFRQADMMLIPKRYQVLSQESHYFGGHLQAIGRTLWGWVKSGFKQKVEWGQLTEPRAYQQVKLKDSVTGKTLTVFNSHTSYYSQLQTVHMKQLMDAARAASKQGPVIVAGDLNTRTAETDQNPNSPHAKARAEMHGFEDMGLPGNPPGKPNIDWVLAKGFSSVSSKWYTGDSLSLPGSPNAASVSDHYAEEDVLRYD